MQSGGSEALSIRRLASALEVSPMAVYRHVRNKDDLLDEVVDRLLADAWQPSCEATDWERWVQEAADHLRAFLVAQPVALEVYLRHPVTSPAAIARMDAMLGVLRWGISDDEDARRAYAAIHTYTVGFAALQASRLASSAGVERGLASELSSYTTTTQFRVGLRCLVAGLMAIA